MQSNKRKKRTPIRISIYVAFVLMGVMYMAQVIIYFNLQNNRPVADSSSPDPVRVKLPLKRKRIGETHALSNRVGIKDNHQNKIGKKINPSKRQKVEVTQEIKAPKNYEATIALNFKNKEKPRKESVRLEFLHIPKTGGTTVEATAGLSGIAWGSCHFNLYKKWKICPKLNLTSINKHQWNSTDVKGAWHRPLQHLPSSFPSNPYDILAMNQSRPIGDDVRENVTFFAIIRNPYERILSEYYFKINFYDHYQTKKNRTKFMNKWVKKKLNAFHKRGSYFLETGHFIPQSDFIYNTTGDGERIVRHVLRFEQLSTDFHSLMRQYDLNITLPEKKLKTGKDENNKNISDLSDENIMMINEIYRNDFIIGNYTMIHPRPRLDVYQFDGDVEDVDDVVEDVE